MVNENTQIEVTLSTLFCNILHEVLYWEQLRFAIVFKSQDNLAIFGCFLLVVGHFFDLNELYIY